MADELGGDTSVAEESLLERKDAQGLNKTAAYDADAPGAPSPELRADIVNVFYVVRAKLSREAEMKTGEIGKDGESWFAARRFGDEPTHRAHERREMAENLGNANDGDFVVVGYDVHAGCTHVRAAHAEEGDVRQTLL
jgi:hypothetical protein